MWYMLYFTSLSWYKQPHIKSYNTLYMCLTGVEWRRMQCATHRQHATARVTTYTCAVPQFTSNVPKCTCKVLKSTLKVPQFTFTFPTSFMNHFPCTGAARRRMQCATDRRRARRLKTHSGFMESITHVGTTCIVYSILRPCPGK